MRMTLFLVAIIVGGDVIATDRYFSNVSVESPSTRFHLTAESPDNQRFARRPFQSNFEYKCVDRETGKTLWSIRSPNGNWTAPLSLPPTNCFVTDDAWGVVVDSAHQLIIISPNGQLSKPIHLLRDAMTKADRDRYVVETTAGLTWEWNSLWYFVHKQGRPFLVIRPFWGKHIVVDVKGGQLTESLQFEHQIKAFEKQYVLEKLQCAVAHLDENALTNEEINKFMRGASRVKYASLIQHRRANEECRDVLRDSLDAIWLAGALRIQEAADALHKLERSRYAENSSLKSRRRHKLVSCFRVRQLAQLSLRRLGEKVAPLPAYLVLSSSASDEESEQVIEMHHDPNRFTRESQIRGAMKMEDVLQLLGAPDAIQDHMIWIYDFQRPKPHSFKICFGVERGEQGLSVNRIVRVSPPTWKIGTMRDESIREW